MTKKILLRIININIVYIAISAIAYAQNLPTKQGKSVWAPADIKIDGKLKEWGDKLQAHNDPNRIFYTISNDDKNLYLTVRGGGFANEKIIAAGLVFTVQSPTAKKIKGKIENAISITYPVIRNFDDLKIIISSSEVHRKLRDDTIHNRKRIDSLQIAINVLAGKIFKEIKVEGVKEITDTLISVYNETGIHAVALFDRNIQYTYELAIPLAYMSNIIDKDGRFKYDIKQPGQIIENTDNGLMLPPPLVAAGIVPGIGGPFDGYRFYTTDIPGEYTLAKKP